MPLILNIETSTKNCSVALSKGGELLSVRETKKENSHSSVITLFISDVLKESSLDFSLLDAVAVSKGPGSYTGLRIGVSTAKGLCYALNIPLISIGTLRAMAYGMIKEYLSDKHDDNSRLLFCPMIDARRMEVYNAFYDDALQEIKNVSADIIDNNSFLEILEKRKVLFFGDGATKCKSVISSKNAIFIDDIYPSAVNMIEIAKEKYKYKKFEDIAYFEPFYLKDFVAGKPNVKGLY